MANAPPAVPSTGGNEWLRERLLAAYASAIGVDYEHHHDPRWLPQKGTFWNETATVGYQSQGIDGTNFTAWAYADALGIAMNSDTGQQALIGPGNLNGTIVPSSIASRVHLQTITHWTSYSDLVSQLEPGDILCIEGSTKDPKQATHAITRLGSSGKDADGLDQYMVIGSTGTSPAHVNSSNHVIREGVEIRPFGAPGSVNDWYFTHVDHALRIIADDPGTT